MVCLLEASCVWIWGSLLTHALRGNAVTTLPRATLHPQASVLPRVAVLAGMSLQEKRQTQLARKPVGAHSDSDTDFSHVTCCSGIMQREDLRLTENDKLPTMGRD